MKCNTCNGPAVLGNTDNCTDGNGCIVYGRICTNCSQLFPPHLTWHTPTTFEPNGYWRVSRNTTCSKKCRYEITVQKTNEAKKRK